jgi:hypothetical protein
MGGGGKWFATIQGALWTIALQWRDFAKVSDLMKTTLRPFSDKGTHCLLLCFNFCFLPIKT